MKLFGRITVYTSAITLMAFSSVTYMSCKDKTPSAGIDLCASVSCENGGTCFKGLCTCPLGYEGEYCQTRSNARYIGNWKVTEKIKGSSKAANIGMQQTYNIAISSKDNSATLLTVKGLFAQTGSDIEWKIAMMPEMVEIDGQTVEMDNPSLPTNFIFSRYQVVSGTYINIEKGNGSVNSSGTFFDATCYVSYPDSAGQVIDTVTFSGEYF